MLPFAGYPESPTIPPRWQNSHCSHDHCSARSVSRVPAKGRILLLQEQREAACSGVGGEEVLVCLDPSPGCRSHEPVGSPPWESFECITGFSDCHPRRCAAMILLSKALRLKHRFCIFGAIGAMTRDPVYLIADKQLCVKSIRQLRVTRPVDSLSFVEGS